MAATVRIRPRIGPGFATRRSSGSGLPPPRLPKPLIGSPRFPGDQDDNSCRIHPRDADQVPTRPAVMVHRGHGLTVEPAPRGGDDRGGHHIRQRDHGQRSPSPPVQTPADDRRVGEDRHAGDRDEPAEQGGAGRKGIGVRGDQRLDRRIRRERDRGGERETPLNRRIVQGLRRKANWRIAIGATMLIAASPSTAMTASGSTALETLATQGSGRVQRSLPVRGRVAAGLRASMRTNRPIRPARPTGRRSRRRRSR